MRCLKYSIWFVVTFILSVGASLVSYGWGGGNSSVSTKYWDRNSWYYGFGSDLDGVWNEDETPNWSTSSSGFLTTTRWDDWDRAVFSGTDSSGSFEVEMDGTIKASSLSFDGSDAFLVDNNWYTGSLELKDSSSYINVSSGVNVTIDVELEGSKGFIKKGEGTLTITHEGSISGDVTIEGGTVRLANVAGPSLERLSSIEIENGGTIAFDEDNQLDSGVDIILAGGTMETNGTTQTMDTLTLTADSVIDLGASGAGDIYFDSSKNKTWSCDATLNIINWMGDETGGVGSRIFFGNSASGLTEEQLSQITINGQAVQLLDTGELVVMRVVPEPSTYIFGALIIFFIIGHIILRYYRKRAYSKSVNVRIEDDDLTH